MKKKLILGSVLSLVLVYLSVRGIDFQGIADSFKTIRYSFVLPSVAAMMLMQVLRSVRWGEILSPLEKINQLSLLSATCVGFFAIVAIPARLGELARPILITQKSHIKMSAAVGTIVVERIFDGLSILVITSFVPLFLTDLPIWLISSGLIFSLITFMLLSCMFFMTVKRKKALALFSPITRLLPSRYVEKADGLIHHFIDGLQVITDLRQLVRISILSITIWVADVAAFYMLFLACGLDLPVAAAVVVLVILIIGIAIPTAPGFIGNWHYACILGLGLFGISKTDALAYAVVTHFLTLIITIIPGLIFLPFNRLSIANLKQQWSEAGSHPASSPSE
jgi:glycosyltransferase 2 family protein